MVYPIMRALRGHGYSDITVAHPKTLAWIVKSKKNDRVDDLKRRCQAVGLVGPPTPEKAEEPVPVTVFLIGIAILFLG